MEQGRSFIEQERRSRARGLAIVVTLAGSAAGLIVGVILGRHEAQAIAEAVRRVSPNDPLDMLPFVSLFEVVLCVALGTIIGVVAGVLVHSRLMKGGSQES
jgi:ABC-type antimicrobial peptide transport system permease subunit